MQYLQNEWILKDSEEDFESGVVNVFPNIEQQTVLGFGGAFTEAAAYNYSLMSQAQKDQFMEDYFGKTGNGYRVGRIHMGSCDFALAPYSEATKEDLSDFNIQQDKKYILPMVKDALKKTDGKMFLFASPWSPPAFMKDNGQLNGGGKLKKEFYPTYAQLFVKFIQAYAAEGIKISAVTVQNEARAKQTWESCRYTPAEEAEFATDFLRPALDKAGLSDVKILVWDHNKERVVDRAEEIYSYPGADQAIWGMGYHWYSGEYFDGIDLYRKLFPNKEILATEFCHEMIGTFNEEKRNIEYATEYIESLRHGAAGLCDWNLLLDPEGGPFHWRRVGGGCAAAMYFDAEKKELVKDGIYGAIHTVTHNVEPGDKVIASTMFDNTLPAVAVKKKNGEIFLFILNKKDSEIEINIRMGKKGGSFKLPANSVSANKLI